MITVGCHGDRADELGEALLEQGVWGAIARGRLLAWGRKQWLDPKFKNRFFNP
ncbi:MAG: hypothetical protein ACRDQI_04125 [Pseudonocardiaceae bacterium]